MTAHAEGLLGGWNDVQSDEPVVIAKVAEGLVDKSRVVEVEWVDPATLPRRTVYRAFKRGFDVVGSAVALVVLAVPMAAVAVAVKIDSPGPVFFKQERLGKDGKPFTLVKFRTMCVNAEEEGAQWALDGDPRVTKLGRVLRNTRFDEVPQFWGVIKGDLSIVGPRPERKVFYDEFCKYIHGFEQRMMVRPGITGLAQVEGGYDLLPEYKIQYDMKYIKEQNLFMDLRILAKTVGVVLKAGERVA
jgi:lipopolysaccharide/colanic/teichoic acid biosynthesis glycosyltransferase